MNYKDAFILANTDGGFIEGFIRCTFVVLYDKQGHRLYTVKGKYADFPGITFTRTVKNNSSKGRVLFNTPSSQVPICRAYDYKEGHSRVPIVPSKELKYVIQQLIFNSPTAPDTWKLYRKWKKDGLAGRTAHKQGEIELLTEQYNTPEVLIPGNSRSMGSYIAGENDYYIEYWVQPQYDYALTDQYIELLNILESDKELYVRADAVEWHTDMAVVTTISDPILTDDEGNLITDENGEAVVLVDDNGEIVPTDVNGKPIFPEGYELNIGTEELEAAKRQLDQAKAMLAAAGATMFL